MVKMSNQITEIEWTFHAGFVVVICNARGDLYRSPFFFKKVTNAKARRKRKMQNRMPFIFSSINYYY